MQITEVYYQRNFQVGDFLYEHYGVKISVNTNENIDDAYAECEKIVKEQHYTKNKDYYAMLASQNVPIDLPVTQVEKPKYTYPVATDDDVVKEIQSFKLGINPFIAVYSEMVKGNTKLEEAYQNKLIELQK